MGFDTQSEPPIQNGLFAGNLSPFGAIKIEESPADYFSFSGTFERDPILRNRFLVEAAYGNKFLTITAGPSFGILNSGEVWLNPGFQAGLGLQFPGVIFARFTAGSTLGRFHAEGDYTGQNALIEAGFWLPHLISSVIVSTKNYERLAAESRSIRDESLRIIYRADVYDKGFPCVFRVNFGYGQISRSRDSPPAQDVFNFALLGAEVSARILPEFRLILGFETAVYSWGKSPLKRGGNLLFFEAYTGFSLTIGEKKTSGAD